MLTIWGRASSVNVQKVLWTADELGLAYERIDAGGKFGGLSDAAYRAMNPNGLIPTIRDGSGTGEEVVLWESNAIVRYLAARYGADDANAGDANSGAAPLWPRDPARRALADRWMDWALTTINEPMRVLFWGLVRDPVNAKVDEMLRAEEQSGELWARLDAWLAEHGPFIAGDSLSIGDIPVGCQVQRWLSFPIQRPSLPHLEAWHKRLAERPGYRKWVMVKME
ncbi:glutathione S-transferase family protein [uncultured Ferrovibrio sp.]|uniref:glutathione S-transferase family protein n=1 Tax=uncultured Ferrovibrio sp. TaxID=1576913 RepID=UPI00262541E7|nr:glutathione S-transferase family protein [uncultured Ferrovibrio sp.]